MQNPDVAIAATSVTETQVAHRKTRSANFSKKTSKTRWQSGGPPNTRTSSPRIPRNYSATFCVSISTCASVKTGWNKRLVGYWFAPWQGTRILQPDRAIGLGIRLRMRCYRGCAFGPGASLSRQAATAGALCGILGKVVFVVSPAREAAGRDEWLQLKVPARSWVRMGEF